MKTLSELEQVDAINDITVKFDDRHLRMERHGDSYRITWFKPDENNGNVFVASSVVLSSLAMMATVKAYMKIIGVEE